MWDMKWAVGSPRVALDAAVTAAVAVLIVAVGWVGRHVTVANGLDARISSDVYCRGALYAAWLLHPDVTPPAALMPSIACAVEYR